MTSAPEALRLRRPAFDAVPWLTIYVVVLLMLPSAVVIAPLGSAGSPSMLLGLGSLVLWVWLRISAVRREGPGWYPVVVALGIFCFGVGISYAIAMSHPIDPDEVSPADVALLQLASWSGTLLLAHDAVRNRARLDSMVWRIVVCAGLLALLGLIQVFTKQLWIDQLSVPGLTVNAEVGTGVDVRGAYVRPSGTSITPLEFGAVITMLFPLALHAGFFHRQRNIVVRWLPAVAIAALVPLSSSRSAYVGAIVGLAVCLLGWGWRRRWVAFGLIAVGIGAFALISPNFVNSVLGLFADAGTDPSVTSRTDSYPIAIEFILRNPLFGRGLGTFLPEYRIFDNQYLLLLVTVGVVGTLAFVALIIVAVVVLVRTRLRSIDPSTRDLAVMLIASIAVISVELATFDAFAFPMTMGAMFLTLGLSSALARFESASPMLAPSLG